jgi:hypothetical protein
VSQGAPLHLLYGPSEQEGGSQLMVEVATDNGSASSSRITMSSTIAEAIIILPDGRRIILDEGWRVEACGTLNARAELREIALVRDGIRLTFAVRMVKPRSVSRVRTSLRTRPRRYRAVPTHLNTGPKPTHACSDEATSFSGDPEH